jgi:integrase
MDVKNLRENHQKLISRMESDGYSKHYVSLFKSEIKNILNFADSGRIHNYEDAYELYKISGLSPNSVIGKGTMIAAIEKFDLCGLYPDGSIKQTYTPKGAYHALCPEYKTIADHFTERARESGKRDSSILTQHHAISVFLLSLQNQNVVRLTDITQDNILSIFIDSNGSAVKSSCLNQIAIVLKTCIPKFPECEKVLLLLPLRGKKRKNIQYLTEEEVMKIKCVLSETSTILTLRDKAIGIMALYTGLRRSDIANLKIDSIDWEKDTITVIQQKTEVPLILPLTAIVGNAIHDYIKLERPKVDSDYIFITRNRPFRRLRANTGMPEISSTIMKAAGIRQENGDRQGFHIFRHHFATALLGNGIPRPVISSLTGQLAPESLDTYLFADFPHLKECALTIEHFPVKEGVYSL